MIVAIVIIIVPSLLTVSVEQWSRGKLRLMKLIKVN